MMGCRQHHAWDVNISAVAIDAADAIIAERLWLRRLNTAIDRCTPNATRAARFNADDNAKNA